MCERVKTEGYVNLLETLVNPPRHSHIRLGQEKLFHLDRPEGSELCHQLTQQTHDALQLGRLLGKDKVDPSNHGLEE